jgi:hypothetical protein
MNVHPAFGCLFVIRRFMVATSEALVWVDYAVWWDGTVQFLNFYLT